MPRTIQKKNEEEDPNAKWSHALSLQDTKLWQDKQNELDFMKDLFFERMPMGPDRDKMNEYFNLVQKAIDTKDESLQYEHFPSFSEGVDIDGAVKDPPTTYHYFQSLLLEQQAKREFERELFSAIEAEHKPESESQDVDDPAHERESQASEDESQESFDVPHDPFNEDSSDSQASEQ